MAQKQNQQTAREVYLDITHPEIGGYLNELCREKHPVFEEMEALALERGFPIVGPQVGRLLSILTRLTGAKHVFEMGSGYGYSACWFARALPEDGTIHLTEGDRGNSKMSHEFMRRVGAAEKATFHVGDAPEIYAAHEGPVDILFIDVDKTQYPDCYRLFKDRLRSGAMVFVDNTLWGGAVVRNDGHDTTAAILEFTRLMKEDPTFETTILPIRDGVLAAVKK